MADSIQPTPFRVLVGIDFSEIAALALADAIEEVASRPLAELHLATVFDSDHLEIVPLEDRKKSLSGIADSLAERLASTAAAAWDRHRTLIPSTKPAPTFAHVRVGAIAEQLATLAADVHADLVVVGTHGRRGLTRLMMGSVAERTVRLAPCPVLVVRPRDVTHEPCAACVNARAASVGASWWCATHRSEVDSAYSRSARL